MNILDEIVYFQPHILQDWSIKHCKDLRKSICITNRRSQTSKNITKGGTVSAKFRILFEMPKKNKTSSLDSAETKVKIIDESDQEVKVYRLQSYGCGIDCHSKNIVVSVHVIRNGDFYERHKTFATTWNSLLEAKEWAIERIKTCSDPVPDLSLPLHYTIEATATYHMPVIAAWEGKPSIINPALAGATKRKSDPLDAARLSFHDLSGVWRESFPISREIHELRVLISAREHFDKLATQAGNRINNIITRFGFTLGRSGSVTKNPDIRAIVENLISDNPHEYENLCPIPLPKSVKEVIKVEYEIYDTNERRASEYFDIIKKKVYAIDWQIPSGTIPGEEAVQILCSAPGIGEVTSFKWLAFVATPCRFRSAKALNAYSGLDPTLRSSGGKITGKKTRGGCRILHAALIQCAFIIISNASEAFGIWGARFAEITKKKKKAANAVARKLNTALYYMMISKQKFSYENYAIAKESATFNIPVEELLVINPSFKRYIKYLLAADIHTTSEMVVAYLSRKLDSIRGLGRKFFTIFKDFLHNQPKYKKDYINLKKGAIQDA